jgi:hypothetical protein
MFLNIILLIALVFLFIIKIIELKNEANFDRERIKNAKFQRDAIDIALSALLKLLSRQGEPFIPETLDPPGSDPSGLEIVSDDEDKPTFTP